MSNFNTTFQISVPGAGTPQFSQNSNGNLTIAGTLTELSSREAKQNFNSVDSLNVLQKVVDLPITMWSYKQDPNVRHIGPMAEDFHKAFNVGDTDKGIAVTDRTGVAFAAIQGLHQELTAKQAEIDRLAKENADLAARLTRLEEKINQQ
jgi:predicted  nucleic acid-binding Zn ribbon protein